MMYCVSISCALRQKQSRKSARDEEKCFLLSLFTRGNIQHYSLLKHLVWRTHKDLSEELFARHTSTWKDAYPKYILLRAIIKTPQLFHNHDEKELRKIATWDQSLTCQHRLSTLDHAIVSQQKGRFKLTTRINSQKDTWKTERYIPSPPLFSCASCGFNNWQVLLYHRDMS